MIAVFGGYGNDGRAFCYGSYHAGCANGGNGGVAALPRHVAVGGVGG